MIKNLQNALNPQKYNSINKLDLCDDFEMHYTDTEMVKNVELCFMTTVFIPLHEHMFSSKHVLFPSISNFREILVVFPGKYRRSCQWKFMYRYF